MRHEEPQVDGSVADGSPASARDRLLQRETGAPRWKVCDIRSMYVSSKRNGYARLSPGFITLFARMDHLKETNTNMNMTAVLPSRRRALHVLVTAGLAMLLTSTGLAPTTAKTMSTATSPPSSRVSFSGDTFAVEPNETVDVVGHVHVVSTLSGSEASGWTLEWRTNLSDTTGIGRDTGDRYLGTGADDGLVQLPPGPPVRSASFEPSFTLLPPGPPVHPPSPIRLRVTMFFDETGQRTAIDVTTERGVIGPVD